MDAVSAPIAPLLLLCITNPPPPPLGVHTIYTALSRKLPHATRQALLQPDGFCAIMHRMVEAAPLTLRAGCASLSQAALVESDVPALVRALDEEHGLLLCVVYALPPRRLVYVFEMAGKFLPDCIHVQEELALAVVVEAPATVAETPAAIRVVRESASAGQLPLWTPPAHGKGVIQRVAWVNAVAYAQPLTFWTHAASHTVLAGAHTTE